MGKRDYGYSFEIYAPETDEDAGRRIDYEDHFLTRGGAVQSMKLSMLGDDVPVGSTAFVCRRYDDGEMTDEVDYVKRVVILAINKAEGGDA